MKVPLLDLKLQYFTHKKELDEALLRVAESQYFILGKEVEKLESSLKEYLGCKYAIGVSSGTDALLLALMALNIQPGDEVIVPTFSFFATAGVVSRLNAVPVFADIDPVTFNLDPKDIEKHITPKTKAIIPVHLYGQSAAMDEIITIAKKHQLKIVEDGAQAIGAQYKNGKKVGTIGDIGCYSFFPSKNLGCFGDGGLVVTDDDKLGERLRIMRVHGGKPKYYHKVIGGNFRLDEIQAAVLNVKLPFLDGWSEKRRQNAKLYTQFFMNVGLAEEEGKLFFDEKNKVLLPKAVYKNSDVKNYHIYNQYIIRVEKRDALRKYLGEKEIGTEIYYPVPFHRQECFANLHCHEADFPVSNSAVSDTIALPIFPELTEAQLKYVVDSITEFLKS
ncbi:MAG: DegT/DnrJ/EryC1/StrS family aminotransferase [Ignavibacteria bacterium]|nr:DegT/DnrJ/EryC1/StrS family aminotransferase [Ignavibacteria bacterium]NCS80941.1 DegT/DnrJ/EryC1/StrS family aminotransferase [Ignavibacteria bacterium]PJC59335.1 MAG: transcriptional regulator [Ignavibacteria bacterium CG_4_9_14_0_2_um_filter_37_13]